ncbi:hypothetical protein MPLSOD_140627 [Mesorhizobium sp. SOD10]|nr:hypothetical protein MPLSOD_140627 [Mesorhizobium sp. SOD10]
MIPNRRSALAKSGNRFSDEIMLHRTRMAVQRNVILIQWLELDRAADHIKTIGKNAIWVFPVCVALQRTV